MKRSWIKGTFVLLFMFGLFMNAIPERIEAVTTQNKKVLAVEKKKKDKIRFKKKLVKDLRKDFGEINAKNGGNLEGEFLFHGEFAVWMKSLGVEYIFWDDDEEADYHLTDDVELLKISGSMDRMVSDFTKACSLTTFVKEFKKGLFHVKYKVLEGDPTAYYVAEHYAEIRFKLKKKDKKTYRIQVALDEKDRVLPEALTWLTRDYED